MTFTAYDFKCAVITGAAGGIGRAMAEHFLSQGKKVILVGRTEDKLKTASKELKGAPYYVLDTGKVEDVPDFVKKVTSEHPDVDCLINNAGVQKPLYVNKMEPDEFLDKADQEISINVRGPMHLALRFLPHLKQKEGAVIVNVSSVLGYLPSSIINPVYNGTKALLHFWTLNLRTQLQQDGFGHVKILEIAPPTVSTELHRERDDPKDNSKDKNPSAMSVEEFINDVMKQWQEGRTTIGAGPGQQLVDRWFKEFGEDYAKAEKK